MYNESADTKSCIKEVNGMNIDIKTREQKKFEDFAMVILKLLAELDERDRTEIFNMIVWKHNNKE